MSPTEKEVLDALSQEANKKKKEQKELAENASAESSDSEKKLASEENSVAHENVDAEENSAVHENVDAEGNSVASEKTQKELPQNTDREEAEKSPAVQENSVKNTKEKNKKESKSEPEPKSEEAEKPMTLLDHMKELRVRLTWVIGVVLVGFFLCYGISKPVYDWLTAPLILNLPVGSSLIYTTPQGAFFVYLKVSVVLSFFLSSPYIFYQAWAFVAPGLYKEEKLVLIPLACASAFFFFCGAAFCYFLVFPVAFNFFMGFATDVIVPMISIESYLSFVLKLLIAFGLVFEMPLFAYFLGRMKLLTPARMRKWRKYAILLIFICAAILTPPDVFSQTLMALPMLFLYEISIFIAGYANKSTDSSKKEEKAEEAPQNEAQKESQDQPQEEDSVKTNN